MSNVWFCSDLHLGHKRIGEFRAPLVNSEFENRTRILQDWNNNVTKRDTVYVLGDVCFDVELFDSLNLPGRKILIRGNHDRFQTSKYLQVFDEVEGLLKYKEFWLSHAPIHPDELRNKINLHGHVHYETVSDSRYFNCCVENTIKLKNQSLISLDQIRVIMKERGHKVAGT